MSAFKDAVSADIKAVFINDLEFADTYNINGDQVRAVVDRDILQERPRISSSADAQAVFEEEIRIYIEASDMKRKPVEGEILRLDGTIFLVSEVHDNMGVLEITIKANES